MNITIPDISEMEKVRVKLDNPKKIMITKKNGVTMPITITRPQDLKKYEDKKGVYIFSMEDGSVDYVGATENFYQRMMHHSYLIKNPDIKFVYFLELEDKSDRFVFEILYKYHFFGKVKPEYLVR